MSNSGRNTKTEPIILAFSPEQINRKSIKQVSSCSNLLIPELKPILFATSLIGFAPYSHNDLKPTLSKIRVMLFGISQLIFYYFLYVNIYAMYSYNDVEFKGKILYIAFSIMTTICVQIDYVISIVSHQKLLDYLDLIRRYDEAKKSKHERKREVVIFTWILLFLAVVLSVSIGGLTSQFKVHRQPIYVSILFTTGSIFTSFRILKFVILVRIVRNRFLELNNATLKDLSPESELKNYNKNHDFCEIWKLHGYLVAAAEKLNSLYSVQLAIWIIGYTFSAMCQIYNYGTNDHSSIYHEIRDILLAILFLFALILVTMTCHSAASEANKMGTILFQSKYFRQNYVSHKEECFAIGQFFLLKLFHFSAAGFFNVNLPLLLTISSAMTTYLVILMSAPNNC